MNERADYTGELGNWILLERTVDLLRVVFPFLKLADTTMVPPPYPLSGGPLYGNPPQLAPLFWQEPRGVVLRQAISELEGKCYLDEELKEDKSGRIEEADSFFER